MLKCSMRIKINHGPTYKISIILLKMAGLPEAYLEFYQTSVTEFFAQ